MTQYDTLNVKLSNSQRNKLKSRIRNGNEETLNLSSNVLVILKMRQVFHTHYYLLIELIQYY